MENIIRNDETGLNLTDIRAEMMSYTWWHTIRLGEWLGDPTSEDTSFDG